MSTRSSILAGLLLLGVTAASALADDAAAATNIAGYHLSNRSAFSLPDSARPPFWPIGWVHKGKGQQQVASNATLDPQMFSVTSILLGNPSLAVINERSYGEGEFLRSAKKGGDAARVSVPANLRIRVKRITDGSVVLEAGDQTVTVQLHRPELNEHKDDKDSDLALSQ